MFTFIYRNIILWPFRRAGLQKTITHYLREWQKAEPLVWLLGAIIIGLVLGWTRNPGGLLWLGLGLAAGLLLGHLFWGARP